MAVVCVLLPRFELVVAVGAREALLQGPAALAPESGREQLVGEVSAAAEGFGIHPGMRMGEALARCPRLALVPPDPIGVADAWERVLAALEAAGAMVEPGRPGLACFEARGLQRLHGGSLEGVLEATRETLRRAGVGAARLGAGPSRFCAIVAAAARARARRTGFVMGAEDLAGERVALLRHRPEVAALPEELERLGIATLGALAALPRAAVADRFGRPGLLAHDLANGHDTPLRPRRPSEVLEEVLELEESSSGTQLERLGIATLGDLAALSRAAVADRFGRPGLLAHDLAGGHDTPLLPRRPSEVLEEVLELEESSSGTQLERALGLLVDRLLSRRERDGRTFRVVVLGATLVEGGTWRERVVFREPLSDAGRMRLVLAQRLALLPAPAESLRLSVERFGPPHPAGAALFDDSSARRQVRLREAIRQVRAAAGPGAALRILAVDPDSRVPERRAVLTPFEL